MTLPGDLGSLHDLVRFGADADELVSRGKAAYDADRLLRLAGEAIVLKIGEAAGRLSDDIVAAHPEIRFRRMKEMRNLIAHRYEIVDHDIVWTTLAVELPKDLGKITALLTT